MNIFDYLGVIMVFAITAYIGYRSTKQISELDDFLLAGRKLGKIKSALSLAASEFGGGALIGACAACYTYGIAGIWWNWAAVPAFIILGFYIAPKLRELELTTVPEYFGERYNSKSRILATLMHLCASVAGLSAQFTVAGVALSTLTGWNNSLCLVISTLFILLYTMGGGFIADVDTDILQFIIIIFSIIIVLPLAISNAGGFSNIISSLPDNFLNIGALGFWEPFSWLLLCFFDYATNQYVVVRAFSAKDPKTAKFAFVFTGIFFTIIGAVVAAIGLILVIIMPGLEDPNMGYSLLVSNYLPNGLAGIAIGGIFAATMSTADSSLLDVTALVINDIYKPFICKDADDKKIIRLSRMLTVIACIVGVFIANIMKNIIDIIYLSGLFYGPAVFFPLILGIYWKKTNGVAAFLSMIAAIIVGLISEFFLYGRVEGIFGILPSNLLSALVGITVLIIVSNYSSAWGEKNEKDFS